MMFGQMYYVSYLNTEIANNYEVSDAMVSLIHTLRSGGVVIANFTLCFFPKGVNARLLILICFIISAFCSAMIGPSKLLYLP